MDDDELKLWDIWVYCGGIRQGVLYGVDVETMNYLNLLQYIDCEVVSKLKVDGPIQYTVKYSDPLAWGEYIDIDNDMDLIDMFVAHRRRDVISVHLTYKPAIPFLTEPCKPTPDEVSEVFLLPPNFPENPQISPVELEIPLTTPTVPENTQTISPVPETSPAISGNPQTTPEVPENAQTIPEVSDTTLPISKQSARTETTPAVSDEPPASPPTSAISGNPQTTPEVPENAQTIPEVSDTILPISKQSARTETTPAVCDEPPASPPTSAVSGNPQTTPEVPENAQTIPGVSDTTLPISKQSARTETTPAGSDEPPATPLIAAPHPHNTPAVTETTPQFTETPPPTSASHSSMFKTPTDKHNKWNDLKKRARAAMKTPTKGRFSGKEIPPMTLVDEETTEEDSPTDSSDEDGVHPPPAVELDEETIRRMEAEADEYFKEVDDVVNLSDEEQQWMGEGVGSDDEDYADLVDEELLADDDELEDYNSEDNLHIPVSDSELEPGSSRVYKAFVGKPPALDSAGKVVLEVGQVYTCGKHLRDTLRDYCVDNGFEFKRVKNEPTRITWKCKIEECPWRVHASVLKDGITFKIKTLNEHHSCSRSNTNVEANSTWMARRLLECFREDPNVSTSGVQGKLKAKFGLEVNCQKQLYRARVRALEELEGSHRKSYEQLSAYRDELMKTNPGSLFKVEFCDEESGVPKFKRLFMSIGGLKNGFINGCRPLIGLDGCHLKGPYKGTLLSAVSLDGNNGVYPICWAVVESEDTDTWSFFCQLLAEILDADMDDTQWCFMTDGQKGLPSVVQKYFPGAEHRRCAWHLFNNFRAKYSGVLLAKFFWKASRAYNEPDFRHAMGVIKETNSEAFNWLIKLNPKFWSRHAYGQGTKSDHITNNHTESFNGWLGNLREKPIVKMVDGIRQKVMVRVHKRFILSEKWDGVLCDNIRKKLVKIVESGRKCTVHAASNDEFEVYDAKMVAFTVDLADRTCSCGSWGITGIPCKHAATCVAYCRKQIVDFVDRCYFKETFQKANGQYIVHPIHDPTFWGPGTAQKPAPPKVKRGRGRPRNVRRRDHNLEPAAASTGLRSSGIIQCSICKGWGHNARTCGRVPFDFMSPQEQALYQSSQAENRKRKADGEGSSSKGKGTKKTKTAAADGVTQSQPSTRVTRSRSAGKTGGVGQGSSQP